MLRCIIMAWCIFHKLDLYNCGATTNYYISNDGSDEFNGTSPEQVTNTKDGPWKTLSYAISKIRKIRKHFPSSSNHVTINMLPGTYFLNEQIKLASPDSYMTIKAYSGKGTVIISEGMELNGPWINLEGDKKQTSFAGKCGEAFVGDSRLIPARTTNLPSTRRTLNLGSGPWNYVVDLAEPGPNCVRESKSFRQADCPDANSHGFIFDTPYSAPSSWPDLDQTKVLVMHSWIAEYATISDIVEKPNSKLWEVKLKAALKHAKIGEWAKSGGWRYVFMNNVEFLDAVGEYVCVERDDSAEFTYISPEDMLPDEKVVVSQQGIIFYLL